MAEGLLRMTLRQVPRAMGGKPTTPIFEGAHEGHEAPTSILLRIAGEDKEGVFFVVSHHLPVSTGNFLFTQPSNPSSITDTLLYSLSRNRK
jgi:hypothetical protein